MNDEIKAILADLNLNVYETKEWKEPLGLSQRAWKTLLDYITNLQKENERLTNELNTCMIERNNFLSRIEKAVEYIKKHTEKCNIDGYEGKFDNFDIFTKPQKLIDILNGRSDE